MNKHFVNKLAFPIVMLITYSTFSELHGGHGSVQFGYGVHGTARAVPVFGSNGSSGGRASRHFTRVLAERPGSGFGP